MHLVMKILPKLKLGLPQHQTHHQNLVLLSLRSESFDQDFLFLDTPIIKIVKCVCGREGQIHRCKQTILSVGQGTCPCGALRVNFMYGSMRWCRKRNCLLGWLSMVVKPETRRQAGKYLIPVFYYTTIAPHR